MFIGVAEKSSRRESNTILLQNCSGKDHTIFTRLRNTSDMEVTRNDWSQYMYVSRETHKDIKHKYCGPTANRKMQYSLQLDILRST